MKEAEVLEHLERIVEQLGIELRYDLGDFKGGICRVDDKKVLIVNKRLLEPQKISLISQELATVDLSNVFIIPAIREIIESAVRSEGQTEE